MARVKLKTASQTKNFIKRMNKFYQKLDICKQYGTTRTYTGHNDITVKVYRYRKYRVKVLDNCVWLCVAENSTDPNCMHMWDYYEPTERLAWLNYPPKRIFIKERFMQDCGSYWERTRD